MALKFLASKLGRPFEQIKKKFSTSLFSVMIKLLKSMTWQIGAIVKSKHWSKLTNKSNDNIKRGNNVFIRRVDEDWLIDGHDFHSLQNTVLG